LAIRRLGKRGYGQAGDVADRPALGVCVLVTLTLVVFDPPMLMVKLKVKGKKKNCR